MTMGGERDYRSTTPYLGSINHDEAPTEIVVTRPDMVSTNALLMMTDSSITPISNDGESHNFTRRSGLNLQTITDIDQHSIYK